MQAIYVPADDLTDPAPATTFAHLDATTVLSRAIAEWSHSNYLPNEQYLLNIILKGTKMTVNSTRLINFDTDQIIVNVKIQKMKIVKKTLKFHLKRSLKNSLFSNFCVLFELQKTTYGPFYDFIISLGGYFGVNISVN